MTSESPGKAPTSGLSCSGGVTGSVLMLWKTSFGDPDPCGFWPVTHS